MQLKPCPFCGENEQEVSELTDGVTKTIQNYEVRCGYCDARSGKCGKPKAAQLEWNKRVNEQDLADLHKEHENAIGLKNTYFQNWKDAKATIDSQAEVINNLTVRWGKVCRELADLKRLVREFIEIVDSTMHHKSEFVFYLKKRDEVKQAVKEE